MKLLPADVELFYRLHPALLAYANQQLHIVSHATNLQEFMSLSTEDKYDIRNALYAHIHVVDDFVRENPHSLTPDELALVQSWKDVLQGRFYIFRHLKKYTVFLDADSPAKAYGVLSLHDGLDEVFPYLPIMVEAVLLPWKGQIIYDGLMSPYNIFFGRGIRSGLNDSYQQAKAQFGIITSLPFAPRKVTNGDSDRLKFYLRSERNRNMYGDEITALIHKDQRLRTLYHQEMGKIHARTYSRQLRDIGVTGAWFAILEGLTIASGTTRNEAERMAHRLAPRQKWPFVYLFQVKENANRTRKRT